VTATLVPFEVACPTCDSHFPVDPHRVPVDGILAVCSSCMRAFAVSLPDEMVSTVEQLLAGGGTEGLREAASPEAATEAPDAVGSAPPATTPEAAPSDFAAPPAGADAPVVTPPPEPSLPEPTVHDLRGLADEALSEVDDEPEADAPLAGDAALSRGFHRFGRRDPHERARRLARVLVSDIIAYYPEKHEAAVERGTVKEEFEEEVQKSWKEYVDQVGDELANSTDYFTEALNQVLARGREIY
jgi:hypothetical protein